MSHLTFLDGKYSTAPGLVALHKAGQEAEPFIFLIDPDYGRYLENKKACRRENIGKYYRDAGTPPELARKINRYFVHQLCKEYPQHFSFHRHGEQYRLENRLAGETLRWEADWISIDNEGYLSLFDGLCCCVQEDVAVCQVEGQDRLSILHICSPNYWNPAEKAGKPFHMIHAIIPGMEKTIQHSPRMLQAVVHKGPFERYAWGIASDNRLNHHTLAPPGIDDQVWQGRNITREGELFLRVEKQHTIGFPDSNAFLFTIRTSFYAVDTLSIPEKTALLQAVESMSAASLLYKGLSGRVEVLKERLCVGGEG